MLNGIMADSCTSKVSGLSIYLSIYTSIHPSIYINVDIALSEGKEVVLLF